MRTKKKIALTALSAILVGALGSGTVLAFAHEATNGHDYDDKYDVVWENFDRADISDTTNRVDGTVNLGEKPYFHVVYDETSNANVPDQGIYKQAAGGIGELPKTGSNTLTFVMRSPEEDVKLEDLVLGLRENSLNSSEKLANVSFAELVNEDASTFAEAYGEAVASEWTEYTLHFGNTYDGITYDESDLSVSGENTAAILAGFHLYTVDESKSGTLDISEIYYTTGEGTTYLNNFMGGDTAVETAKATNENTWWASNTGEGVGVVVKRRPEISGSGSLTVTKDTAISDYAYAVIEAEGDIEHLTVATTTDGTNYGDAVAYDGSVELAGGEKGFKFSYEGETSVKIKRIYLTNLFTGTPATAHPVIDASTADILDDFSFTTTSIYHGNNFPWGNAPAEYATAGVDYRISYKNENLVKVENGCLEFNGAGLESDSDYINYKFTMLQASAGQYLVFKVKGEDGANFSRMEIGLISENDAQGDKAHASSATMKSGLQFASNIALDKTNPYSAGDGWYYVIVDIAETGLTVCDKGYTGLDMYYRGTGKLLVDSIFFADKLANVEQDFTSEGVKYAGGEEGYDYAGGFDLNNKYGTATALSFDITPDGDGFSPDTLRLGMGAGVYWAHNNPQGQLITTDGKYLNELTYTKGVATHVDIDLEASGIGAFTDVHVHVSQIGGFTLNNVALHTSTAKEDFREHASTVALDKVIVFDGTGDGYSWAGAIEPEYNDYAILEFELSGGEDFDCSGIRFQFSNGAWGWFSQNDQGVLKTVDGKLISELTLKTDEPNVIKIDLAASGVIGAFEKIDIHTNGTGTGAFKIENIKFTPYANNYAEEVEKLVVALDKTAPTVEITTPVTATAGDEIEVKYTATDDVTQNLEVTVTVTKDGNAVTLKNNKFTAQEGVYVVTVVATDENGNQTEKTIQIKVEAKVEPEKPDNPGTTPEKPDNPGTTPETPEKPDNPGTTPETPDNPEEPKSGCGSSVNGGGIGALVALGTIAGALAITVAVRRKKN